MIAAVSYGAAVSDDDETPRNKRARSEPGMSLTPPRNRDEYVPKHSSNAFGVPILRDFELTPPPREVPDEVEMIAARVDTRARAVANRPGPTPTHGAIQTALTLHGVQAAINNKFDELKKHIDDQILEEWKKDREVVRNSQTRDIESRTAWGKLVRDGVWKLLAGGAVLFAILREWLASKK